MDDVLFLLVKKGAMDSPVRLSTTAAGVLLGMSQQNASRRLRLLERDGLITCGKAGLEIAASGKALVLNEYKTLGAALRKTKPKRILLRGVVVDGFGEGRYYVEKYSSRLKKILGGKPYPGTLNVKIDAESIGARSELDKLPPIVVDGFEDGGRQYGTLNVYRCVVGNENAVIVIPARTHHTAEIVEVVAVKRLKKSVGDNVSINVE